MKGEAVENKMDDKVILLSLFNDNTLRTSLIDYIYYICSTDSASALLKKCVKYFSEPTKSLKMTLDDLDTILSAEFEPDSEEANLWKEVKATDISDFDVIRPAVIKYISQRLKECFLAEAFTDDNYNLDKLEDLYRLLGSLNNNQEAEQQSENIDLSDIDSCCESYEEKRDGVKFFDERVSDTLSAKQFDCGTINTIVGSPGKGKTQLILNQHVYVASQKQHTLHVAIGDLTKRQLILRILAIITSKSIQQISLLNSKQFKEFMTRAREKYADIFEHLHCITMMPNTFTGLEIIRHIEDLQKKKGYNFKQVIIDYDGNIETDISTNKKKSKDEESKSMYYSAADIYNNFSAFAKRNDSVVWVLSQPKIQYWSVEKIPLEALNDSSKKGHILDFCMSIGRKDISEPVVTLYISKNRHGESDKTFKLKTIPECQKFEPMQKGDYWNDDGKSDS